MNEGFSGGEKKRHEIAQLELLDPKVAVLDETDSGLDIDALKVVSEGSTGSVPRRRKGVLLITHYTRILRYIKPDFVHVFVAGRIAEQGGPELAEQLEAEGYDKYVKAAAVSSSVEPVETTSGVTPREENSMIEGLLPDLDVVRKDFPILSRVLANGAAAGLPRLGQHLAEAAVVIDTMVDHLERHNANIARAMHQLGAESTEAYEGARDKVAAFIGAPDRDEVVFTKNASEALNLAAAHLGVAGRATGRPRRRDRDHRDGAPLQHRAVAAALRAHRRDAAVVRSHRRRTARPQPSSTTSSPSAPGSSR